MYNIKAFFCALQLYSALRLCPVRSFQKNLLKIPLLPRSKPTPRAISFWCQRTSAFREQVHAEVHLPPEASCIQPRTHLSNLLQNLSLCDVPPAGTPSQPHAAQVSLFPPASTFHGACLTPAKNNPLLLDSIHHKPLLHHLA